MKRWRCWSENPVLISKIKHFPISFGVLSSPPFLPTHWTTCPPIPHPSEHISITTTWNYCRAALYNIRRMKTQLISGMSEDSRQSTPKSGGREADRSAQQGRLEEAVNTRTASETGLANFSAMHHYIELLVSKDCSIMLHGMDFQKRAILSIFPKSCHDTLGKIAKLGCSWRCCFIVTVTKCRGEPSEHICVGNCYIKTLNSSLLGLDTLPSTAKQAPLQFLSNFSRQAHVKLLLYRYPNFC